MQGLKQRAIAGAVWSLAARFANSLISLAVFTALARLLAPEAFGLLAMAMVFVQILLTVVQQGMGMAIVQREKLDPEHLDAAFLWSAGFGLLGLAVCQAGAGPVAAMYGEPELEPLLRVLSTIFLLSGLGSVPRGLLQRDMRFKAIAAWGTAGALLSGLVAVAVAAAGGGVWALAAQSLTVSLVGTASAWALARWRPALRWSTPHFRDLFGVSAKLLGISLVQMASTRSADLLLGLFLGPAALGFYSVGKRVLDMSNQLLSAAVGQVSVAAFSRAQDDAARVRRGFLTAVRLTALYCVAFFGAMAAAGPEVVSVVFGEKWTPSGPVLSVLALGGIIASLNRFNHPALIGVGRSGAAFLLVTVHAVVNVALFAVAAPHGIIWVAAAFVARAILLFPVALEMLRRIIGLSPRAYFRAVAAPLIAGAALVWTMKGVDTALAAQLAPWVRLCAMLAAGGAVYAAVCFAVEPALLREMGQLVQERIRGGAPASPKAESAAPASTSEAGSVSESEAAQSRTDDRGA